jgi:feruloyl-CoA synthase
VNTDPGASLDHAHSHAHADSVCRIDFTSGKGVINTHRNWCSNQEQMRGLFKFLADEPPVTVGGTESVGLVLYNGGSLYVDHGESVHNLKVIAPTLYWNVPARFEALIPYLHKDAAFRKHFFSRLKLLYCTEPGLSQEAWNDLSEISAAECGHRVLMRTGVGSAETGTHPLPGLPAPGMELKLVPAGKGKFEARLRGPNITWGYWRRLDQTRAAFDEEGFFKSGDYLRFVNEGEPSQGFVFDGRGEGGLYSPN